MNKKETDKLRQSLNMYKVKIQNIIPYLGENKPVLNQTFNQLLIEKAVLRDKLLKQDPPFFIKLAEKLKLNSFHSKKTLICDYFK